MTKEIKKGLSAIVPPNSKVLILGTFPSEKSLEKRSYYKGSNNSFWRIIGNVFGEGNLKDKDENEKYLFLINHNIALWDILEEAERTNGSSEDSNTKGLKYNDIKGLLSDFPTIRTIIVHSREAEKELKKYLKENNVNISYKYVPSSSNNYSVKVDKKIEEWKKVFKELGLI